MILYNLDNQPVTVDLAQLEVLLKAGWTKTKKVVQQKPKVQQPVRKENSDPRPIKKVVAKRLVQ